MSQLKWNSRTAAFEKKGDPYAPGESEPRELEEDPTQEKTAATMFRIRKRTTLGEVFLAFMEELSERVMKEMGLDTVENLDVEIRSGDDMGFRYTMRTEAGDAILYYVDISLQLAPDYLRLNVKGSSEETDFSSTLRMFLTDKISKIARRIAGKIPDLV